MTNHYRISIDPIEIPLSGPPPCSVVFTGFTTPEQANAFFQFVQDEIFAGYAVTGIFNSYMEKKGTIEKVELSGPKNMFGETVLVVEVNITYRDEHETPSNN